jgi:hypothetical protein
MASCSAELHVAGHVFPVTHCHFDVTQTTQLRGRVSSKVRYGPVHLVLDVPDGDVLPAWAADPHKQQATAIVFLDANGGLAVETLRLPAAYCVAYQEQFSNCDMADGAYQCFLTLSDPTGWTIAPGGPATAFVAPVAREHGEPAVAASGLRTMAIGGRWELQCKGPRLLWRGPTEYRACPLSKGTRPSRLKGQKKARTANPTSPA